MDAVYAERNAVVLAFAAAMEQLGYDVGQIVDEQEPDWPVLVIETPRGQVSWHMRAEEMPPGVPRHPHDWDGHTTEEKYRRLDRLVAVQFAPDRVAINEDGSDV
jgi:hypothetical protein